MLFVSFSGRGYYWCPNWGPEPRGLVYTVAQLFGLVFEFRPAKMSMFFPSFVGVLMLSILGP